MKVWITGVCSGAVLAMAGALVPATAQQAQAPTAQQQAPAASYSDAQLEKFVGASDKIAMIRQQYTPKLQATHDQGEQQKVVQEANEKMVAAVRDSGMTVNEFNTMGQAIQSDPSLLDRAKKIERSNNAGK